MTVCVAAICQPGVVIGASDRMLTARDIQFEPDRPKIVPLTTSIFAMTAGDAALQDDLLETVRQEIDKRIDEQPSRWLTVKEVAELHAQLYSTEKAKHAETKLLRPLGLTLSSFNAQQIGMSASLVENLSTELLNFEMEDISTIFAGVDLRGPHIFVVANDQIDCHDSVGFAAIGVGEWHASSQLMFQGQSRNSWFPETVLNVYSAKKRAEVAPGVGRGTDMHVVHGLGNSSAFNEYELESLETFWQRLRKREMEANDEAKKNCHTWVQNLIEAAAAKQQNLPEDQKSNPPTDIKEITDGIKGDAAPA